MGTIVALGGGSFEYGEMWPLLRHIRSLCEKENPKWLYLPTASFDNPGDTPQFMSAFKEVGGEGDVKVGNPVIEGAKVEGKVLAQVKGKKIVVYKYKAKKNERKKQGHRQPYTKVEITAINA